MKTDNTHRPVYLVDLDNTLLDFDATQSGALEQLHKKHFEPDIDWHEFSSAYAEINHRLWQQVAEGGIHQDVLRTRRFAELAAKLHLSHPEPAELADEYERFMAEIAIFLPDARRLATLLARHGILVIATNGLADVQRKRLQRSTLDSIASFIWISQEKGFSKPDPRFYLTAIEQARGEPARSIAIGDSIETDGMCAHNAGIDFWWFNPKRTQSKSMRPAREYVALADICNDIEKT